MLDLSKTAGEKKMYEHFRAQIGKEFVPTDIHTALDRGDPSVTDCIYIWHWGAEADYSFIKKWCVANEDFNALWWDEEYAKNSRWGGITAPPLYAIAADDGLEPTFEGFAYVYAHEKELENHMRSLEADTTWEFFEPIRPGDVIDSTAKLSDVIWKQGKRGRLLIIYSETELKNQKGELVARNNSGAVSVFKNLEG
jgi:hypothetical protein